MMKTLDEVIDNFEKACDLERRCEGCSGCLDQENGCPNDGAESVPDALHYLKEYRSEKAMWEADRKGYLDWIEQYKEAREKHQQAVIELKKNPPLTWDELKAMTGKPVWVEGDRGNMWIIVGAFPRWMPDAFADSVPNIWWKKEDLGKTWQAYRKERE